jgi:hypothetical protein
MSASQVVPAELAVSRTLVFVVNTASLPSPNKTAEAA